MTAVAAATTLALAAVLLWPASSPFDRAVSALPRAGADSRWSSPREDQLGGAHPDSPTDLAAGCTTSRTTGLPTAAEMTAVLRRWGARLTGARAEPDLPAMIDAVAAAMRAGLPVVQALESVHRSLGASAPAAARAGVRATSGHGAAAAQHDADLLLGPLSAARAGRSVAAAWHRLARERGSTDLAMVARTWELSERTGAAIGDGLGLAAAAGRDRREVRRKVASATAGARATSTLLTGLPLAGVLLAGAGGMSVAEVYATPVAWVSASLGLALLLLGRRVVRRQIRRVENNA